MAHDEGSPAPDRSTATSLAAFLPSASFPATRDDLVESARVHGAPQDILDAIARLPAERYEAPKDVQRDYARTG